MCCPANAMCTAENVKRPFDENGQFNGRWNYPTRDTQRDRVRGGQRAREKEEEKTIGPGKTKIKDEIFGSGFIYIKYSRYKSIRRNEL